MSIKVVSIVSIDTTFKIVRDNHSELTLIRNFCRFAAKLETHTQLSDKIEYTKKQPPELNAELISCRVVSIRY